MSRLLLWPARLPAAWSEWALPVSWYAQSSLWQSGPCTPPASLLNALERRVKKASVVPGLEEPAEGQVGVQPANCLYTSISGHFKSSKTLPQILLRWFRKCKYSLFYHTEEDTDTLLQLLLATCHLQYNGQNSCRIFIHFLAPAAQGHINILVYHFINSVLSKSVYYIILLWRTMHGNKFKK